MTVTWSSCRMVGETAAVGQPPKHDRLDRPSTGRACLLHPGQLPSGFGRPDRPSLPMGR